MVFTRALWPMTKVNYFKYKNFTSYFDYPLHDTALNTSGAFNGRDLDFVGMVGAFDIFALPFKISLNVTKWTWESFRTRK